MKPEDHRSYDRGNEFETYVSRMFPSDRFELTYRTVTDREAGGEFVEGMEYPDLRLTEISSGRRFWVECKYRVSTRPDGGIAWCDEHQIETYRRIERDSGYPVFVMMGVGGRPDNPFRVYCVNLDHLRFTVVPESRLEACRIHLKKVDNLRQLEFIASQ